jgi:UDP-N-acetylmuramoyl-L-alanyl-D-glutamate--2,6-diaminopimelate ligase
MLLADVLDGVHVSKLFLTMYGKMVLTQDVAIKNIQYDSRRVEHGDMFVAIPGTVTDGHKFIDNAIAQGARVVVVERDDVRPDALFMHANVAKILVPDARAALATMAANYYQHPSHRLRLIGVTGTNGKTTTTYLIKSVLEAAGHTVGVIGTIQYLIGPEVIPATHTTPESLDLNRLLDLMVKRGCTAAVMEVSSHALVQNRTRGLRFEAGIFTNLTQDHLDFHGSMERYFEAKRILFEQLDDTAAAVTNADDEYGPNMVSGVRARVMSYGTSAGADIAASEIKMSIQGIQMIVTRKGRAMSVTSPLTGRFNVENILAAYGGGVALGIPDEQIVAGIERAAPVRGRFEQIVSSAGWTAIIDYAHTPDALENVLSTIQDLLKGAGQGKIITVFGCGGNRDKDKRPKMGRIASTMSAVTIVTSDNPRNEEPQSIIHQIIAGVVPGKTVYTEVDRRRAIVKALLLAEPGDVVLVAGKGHEDYQVVGDTKHHLDDREEVERFLRDTE